MKKANIYLIEMIDFDAHGGYDCYDSHVVQAMTEAKARSLCPEADEFAPSDKPKDRWIGFWNNDIHSKCIIIGKANTGEEKKILSSFNAG